VLAPPSRTRLFVTRDSSGGFASGLEQHVAILIPDGAVVTDQSRKCDDSEGGRHCRAKGRASGANDR